MAKKSKVLFLCTGHPDRCGMAEGFLHKMADERFIAASASVEPAPISPLSLEVMNEVGIDISTQHPKNTSEALKERFAFVVSVCNMAKERNPIFPFAFRIIKWNLEDPEEGNGSPTERLSRFRRVRDTIERNVREFLASTPLDSAATLSFTG